MQPHARRATGPGARNGRREELLPQPLAGEARQQAEIDDFGGTISIGAKLEVPRDFAIHARDPERNVRQSEIAVDLSVRPIQPVAPVIVAADVGVELPVERRRAQITALECY